MTDSDLCDKAQAARYLGGVSTRTVDRLVARGQLRKVKVGGSTFFRQSELDRYLTRPQSCQSVTGCDFLIT